MMRKLLLMVFGLLLGSISYAVNPIGNSFGPFGFAYSPYPRDLPEYYKFWHSCNKKKYKEKEVGKIRAEYEQLISEQPDFAAVAKCVMGYYLINANEQFEAMQKEGLQLLSEGLSELPDTTETEGEQRSNLKMLIGNVCHQLGCAYLRGVGAAQDFSMAFTYYHLEKEHLGASIPLAFCYLLGIGTPINDELAVECCGSVDLSMTPNNVYADLEQMLYLQRWNQEHQADSAALSLFRSGYIKWHIDGDYSGAYDSFMQAIESNYLPAMCELGMLYFDDRWKNHNPKQFEVWLRKAVEAGFYPASHVMGRRYLEHWGTTTPFSSSGEGKAFPFFVEGAKGGYLPSIEMLKKYKNGEYSTKTGLAAAFSDLNKGWKDGNEDGPGLLEGVLMIGGEVSNILSGASGNTVQSPGQSATTTGSATATTTPAKNGGSPSVNSGEIKKYELRYQNWERKASYWIKSFNEAHGWLIGSRGNKSISNLELSNHQRSWSTAQKELKVVLQQLRLARSGASNAGGAIPKGSVESEVETCVSKGYPN